MAGAARIIVTHERWKHEKMGAGDVLAASENGIPIGWFFAFGGRNFWAPDDKVEDRGGSSADRNRYETPLDVAEARLSNAVDALRACDHMWPFYSSLELLHRRIFARGKKGFLRLDATWAFQTPELREKMSENVAHAENMINLLASARYAQVAAAAKPLDEFAPFVPMLVPDDRKRFEKVAAYRSLAGPLRAAALIVGVPPEAEDRQRFEAMVAEQCAPHFAKLATLPPYPAGAQGHASASGVFKKLKGLFGRK